MRSLVFIWQTRLAIGRVSCESCNIFHNIDVVRNSLDRIAVTLCIRVLLEGDLDVVRNFKPISQ